MVSDADCLQYYTPNEISSNDPDTYQHHYIWELPTDATSVTFSLRAENDAHIGLSSQENDVTAMYQIGMHSYS